MANFFKSKGIFYEPLAVASDLVANNTYLSGGCDTFPVSIETADATVSAMSYPNEHMILPERIGASNTAARPDAKPTTQPAGTTPTQPAVQQPVQPAAQPPVQPVDLARPLQAELKRIGCLTGQVDGIWGNGSRAALGRFAQLSGLNLGTEPSQRALTEARNRQAGYCPGVTTKKKRQTQQETPEARCERIMGVCEADAQDICHQDRTQCDDAFFEENLSGCLDHYGCNW